MKKIRNKFIIQLQPKPGIYIQHRVYDRLYYNIQSLGTTEVYVFLITPITSIPRGTNAVPWQREMQTRVHKFLYNPLQGQSFLRGKKGPLLVHCIHELRQFKWTKGVYSVIRVVFLAFIYFLIAYYRRMKHANHLVSRRSFLQLNLYFVDIALTHLTWPLRRQCLTIQLQVSYAVLESMLADN